MNKRVLITAFFSGALLVFFVLLLLLFVYGSIGGIKGWPALNLHLFGKLLLFEMTVEPDGSFSMTWGPGILVLSLLGGVINAVVAGILNRKRS